MSHFLALLLLVREGAVELQFVERAAVVELARLARASSFPAQEGVPHAAARRDYAPMPSCSWLTDRREVVLAFDSGGRDRGLLFHQSVQLGRLQIGLMVDLTEEVELTVVHEAPHGSLVTEVAHRLVEDVVRVVLGQVAPETLTFEVQLSRVVIEDPLVLPQMVRESLETAQLVARVIEGVEDGVSGLVARVGSVVETVLVEALSAGGRRAHEFEVVHRFDVFVLNVATIDLFIYL